MNPILAACMGLGYYFNSYRGQPVVRKGGAVILYHPLDEGFNQNCTTRRTSTSTRRSSPSRRTRGSWGRSTSSSSRRTPGTSTSTAPPHAYHGVHPFYMWYWIAHAMDHVDEVIWVGGTRKAASRMGFRAATTLQDALEMASRHRRYVAVDHLPPQPPPHLLADVR